MNTHSIVIIGAGYAGLFAALRLAGRTRDLNSVKITLVNASDNFVERIRLHQRATNQAQSRFDIPKLLQPTAVQFVQGYVTALEPTRKQITLKQDTGEMTLAYDTLIYALGSMPNLDLIPGLRDHAYTLAGVGSRSAQPLAQTLNELETQSADIIVGGGGLTGIEIATELAEQYPHLRVTLVTREQVGMGLSPRAQGYLRKSFDRLTIRLIEEATITQVGAKDVSLTDGRVLPHTLFVWAGPFTVPGLARAAGLAINTNGQIRVNTILQSLSHPDIYAIGDSATVTPVDNNTLRMACATAIPQGVHVADVLNATLRGQEAAPFRFGYVHQVISLGRRDGLIQWVNADDTPRDFITTGRLAAGYKELVLRLVRLAFFAERRWPGLYRGPAGNLATERTRRQEQTV